MKLFAVLLGALALVAGLTGGLRAYSSSAHGGPTVAVTHVSKPHVPPAQVVRPGPVVKWAPCMKPAVRVGRACVTHVTRTVALPPSPVTTPPVSTPVTSTPPASAPASHAASPQPTRPPPPAADDGGHDDEGGGGDD